jgi:hypothetical protein
MVLVKEVVNPFSESEKLRFENQFPTSKFRKEKMLSVPDDKCLSSLSEKLTQGNYEKDGL